MFAPLAYTKTYAMAAAAILAVTLVPVLMGYFIRGRIVPEARNLVNRTLSTRYAPLLRGVLDYPRTTLVVVLLFLISSLWPLRHIGSEFMPALDEGDLMYMPTTYPGLSIGKARELLQQTDKLIATMPEVDSVFGKIGRAETATDPAPLTMIETFIQLKPREQWRPGMTSEKIKEELDQLIRIPGLSNAWVMPIKTRIDMLATGIKTPVGIKISGPDLKGIEAIGKDLETILLDLPGTASVYSERVAGGRYIKVDIDRGRAARYGLSIDDIQQVVSTAIGGRNVTQTVEGLERYPVNVRYPQEYRDSPEALSLLPIVTPGGMRIALADVADVFIEDGPPGIKSENARLNGWTLVDIEQIDVGTYVEQAQLKVSEQLQLPAGYSISWSGQYEYMQRAKEQLTLVVPLTLLLVILLLYINFRNVAQVAMLIGVLPIAGTGSIWLLYLLDYNLSIAVGIGIIALAGIAIETSVIMLVYLNQAWRDLQQTGAAINTDALKEAVLHGATRRVRPVLMTASATVVGLLPILSGTGTGSEVMSRLAAPMVGGMLSAVALTLLVLPLVYFLWRSRQLQKTRALPDHTGETP
jgi:Cu(I)/Ag(I) efflux system membrane protein CusA/SilA